MPQQLHVVRCSNCEVFQVDIVKKIPKWLCKMCGEKQSLKKVYGTGTGKECREFVQDLNRQRHSLQAASISRNLSDISHTECKEQKDISTCINVSKWSEYVLKSEDTNERLNNFNNTNDDLRAEIIYYNKPITVKKNISGETCVSKSNSNPHNEVEVENEMKLGSCDISKCDNKYEQDIIGLNSIIEVSKKRPCENTEEKFSKWKKFLSNEYHNNTLYSKYGAADDKSSPSQITVSSNTSSKYCNKFGDSSDLDIDLEF